MKTKFYECCELCPNRCRVNRFKEKGYCRSGHEVEIYRYAPHYGEEPPITGNKGSGTVFFSKCTMQCVYCQNYPLSQMGEYYSKGKEKLREAFENLINIGCHNLNLVSPTHWLPDIYEVLTEIFNKKKYTKVVYNTSGFERKEIIEEFGDIVDIFLPDLRYAKEESALKFSKAKNYVKEARNAIKAMYEKVGALHINKDGIAEKGIICRILIIPSLAEEAKESINFLYKEFGKEIGISLMSQYTPTYQTHKFPEINRYLTKEEYIDVLEHLLNMNFKYIWTQDYDMSTEEKFLGFKMKPGFDIEECKIINYK